MKTKPKKTKELFKKRGTSARAYLDTVRECLDAEFEMFKALHQQHYATYHAYGVLHRPAADHMDAHLSAALSQVH